MENKDKVIELIKDQTIQLINETFTESKIKDNFNHILIHIKSSQ